PTIFHLTADDRPGGWSPQTGQKLSLAIGIILFATYFCTLLFTLKTHRGLFAGEGHDEKPPADAPSKKRSLITLVIATIAVAFMSEMLVGSVEAARQTLGFTDVFVGMIVVAIVGNAA